MKFFDKAKITFYNQLLFLIIFVGLILAYRLFNSKVINIFFIPTGITFITYRLLISKIGKEKANVLIYKIWIFIYVYYIEFFFLGLPKFDFLPFPFNSFFIYYFIFLSFIYYLKKKKNENINFFIYLSLGIIFIIPILNHIVTNIYL